MAVNNKKHDLLVDGTEKQMFYSRVYINNSEIPSTNIVSMVMRQWVVLNSFIPRLELVIVDDGLISEIYIPVEGTKILIEIGRSSEDENMIQTQFQVLDYSISRPPNPEETNTVNISAILDVKNLFNNDISRSIKGNSKIVLNKIADDLGLGFVSSSGLSGNDRMTWLQTTNNFQFIKHVTERSFISNDDVLLSYIDINRNFNYRSLKKELQKEVNWDFRFDIDLATSVSKLEMDRLLKNKERPYRPKDVWFSSIDINNYSGTLNNMYGYGINSLYYDMDKEELNSKPINFVDNLINTDDLVKPLYNKIVRSYYEGVIDSRDNNVHNNYNYSRSIRNNIINSFMAQSVMVELNAFSNIQLCDLVNLHLPSNVKDSDYPINETLSGKYIVGCVLYVVSINSILKKRVILSRIGINKQGLV